MAEARRIDTPRPQAPNVGRKRVFASGCCPSPVGPSPGSCSQDALQAAKFSFQVDLAFAASPTGSIGSRFPKPVPVSGVQTAPAHLRQPLDQRFETVKWRYSTAPAVLAALGYDVREPFPADSINLPAGPRIESEDSDTPSREPISSGFTSPIKGIAGDGRHGHQRAVPSRETLRSQQDGMVLSATDSDSATGDSLEACLANLHVAVESIAAGNSEESQSSTEGFGSMSDIEIFLSTPAKAAAESAKRKRGLFQVTRHSSSDNEDYATRSQPPGQADHFHSADVNSMVQVLTTATPCPDPRLHDLASSSAYARPPSMLPPPRLRRSLGVPDLVQTPSFLESLQPNYCRADSRGSPVPTLRGRPPAASPQATSVYAPRSHFSPRGHDHNHVSARRRNVPSASFEHFQPGWYYAAAERVRSPNPYSFSTAAAKAHGLSAAPDSRIRDSYRTDTLTPLACPPSRYRKNGIAAVASKARGKEANAPEGSRRPNQVFPSRRHGRRSSSTGPMACDRPRQFMSSPPRPSSGHANPPLKRMRTSRDQAVQPFEVAEDIPVEPCMSAALAQGDEMVGTTAVVLPGNSITSEVHQRDVEGMRELSPNVTPYRKGHEPKKKRRPSYWDTDLPEVRRMAGGSEDKRGMVVGEEEYPRGHAASDENAAAAAATGSTASSNFEENLGPVTGGGEMQID